MTLREIKSKIDSLKKIQKTTNVMKIISSVKVNKYKNIFNFSMENLDSISAIIANIFQKNEEKSIIFDTNIRKKEKIGLIVLSSDRGLCSNFNYLIYKKINILLKNDSKYRFQKIFSIGKKISDFIQNRFLKIERDVFKIEDFLDKDIFIEFVDEIFEDFISDKFDSFFVVYHDFKNMMNQELKFEQLIPFVENFSSSERLEFKNPDEFGRSVEYFGKEFLKLKLYRILMSHVTSEYCFRMKAMDSATTNARNIIRTKELYYNRMRQSLITKNMIEIISGVESQNQ